MCLFVRQPPHVLPASTLLMVTPCGCFPLFIFLLHVPYLISLLYTIRFYQELSSFDYPPVGSVTLAYPMSALRADRLDADGNLPGFGQLHPRTQGITTLGTIYSSSLFPGRAPAVRGDLLFRVQKCTHENPQGSVLVLNYIGGATNRGIVDQTQEQLVSQVDKDLREMLINPDAPTPEVVGVRVWPRAIPQFNLGHLDTLERAKNGLQAAGYDGVLLGGNYVSGVALGKCVEFAYEYAGSVAKQVSKVKAS